MKFLRFSLIFLLPAVMGLAVSCHKDRASASGSSLTGTLSYNFPEYVQYGDVIHVSPSGVYREDESDTLLSLRWINPFSSVSDTVRVEADPDTMGNDFYFTVDRDTIGTFSLSVYVWASGYSSKSKTVSFTVVNPTPDKGSLRGYGFMDELSTFTDTRDSRSYPYTTVGGKDWFVSNLAYEGTGTSYEEHSVLAPVFGQYYTWDEAGTACPAGWSLPADADFVALAKAAGANVSDDGSVPSGVGTLMGNITYNGDKLWEFWPGVNITNSSRFSAIPVGYAMVDETGTKFIGFNDYAMFWTADATDAFTAKARYIYVDKPEFFVGSFGKSSVMASVRCVRDHE